VLRFSMAVNFFLSSVFGHCLVWHLRSWRASIERLMRSLLVVVVHELRKPLAKALPTAHPRVVEAVDSHLELVNPLLDLGSLRVVHSTAQP
jgi:hypothetical protein